MPRTGSLTPTASHAMSSLDVACIANPNEDRLQVITTGDLHVLQYEKEVNGDLGFSIIGGIDTCVQASPFSSS